MECLYRTATKYTWEEYKKFNDAVILKKNLLPLLILSMVLILAGGILLGNVVVISFAILFPIFFFIFKDIGVKRVFNSNKISQNMEVTYEFYEDYFIQKHEVGEGKIPYEKLDDILETKTNFYLMIAKNQGYMLAKENMPEGLIPFLQDLKKKMNQK